MSLVIVMILLSGGLWWWYFTLRRDARSKGFDVPWMFPIPLLCAWVVSIITIVVFIAVLLNPHVSGESVWL